MRKINEIIVHCSATPEGKDFTAKDIDSWHKQQGFDCIGYHYVIDLDGTIELGRPLSQEGAHCKSGGHNRNSIGICYIGGCKDGRNVDTRTPAQRKALQKLISELVATFHCDVWGHHDFNPGKDCPCFDAHAEYHYLYSRLT